MLKPILISSMVFLSISAMVTEATVQDKQTHINIGQMTFEESIAKLSKIYDIEISLVGTNNLPQHEFNLTLEQATLKQAIKETMRKAGLQNYVLVIDQQLKSTRIWILPAGTTAAGNNLEGDRNIKTITSKQFANLEAAKSENLRMMTQEEYARLEPESKNNYRSMTPEKFENLEAESTENYRSMTLEEFSKLKKAL
jgi:hypothetical protein